MSCHYVGLFHDVASDIPEGTEGIERTGEARGPGKRIRSPGIRFLKP